jgi:hypothetical protein
MLACALNPFALAASQPRILKQVSHTPHSSGQREMSSQVRVPWFMSSAATVHSQFSKESKLSHVNKRSYIRSEAKVSHSSILKLDDAGRVKGFHIQRQSAVRCPVRFVIRPSVRGRYRTICFSNMVKRLTQPPTSFRDGSIRKPVFTQ